MTEYPVFFRMLRLAGLQLVMAREDAMNVMEANKSLVECRRELSEMRRSFLLRGNRPEDVFNLTVMVEKLYIVEVDYAKNKIKYQTSISKVVSYLVEIIKMVAVRDEEIATHKDDKFPYPQYRNDVRAIIRLVNETKGLDIDYSSVALSIASAHGHLAFCKQTEDIVRTAKLFKSLLDSF